MDEEEKNKEGKGEGNEKRIRRAFKWEMEVKQMKIRAIKE